MDMPPSPTYLRMVQIMQHSVVLSTYCWVKHMLNQTQDLAVPALYLCMLHNNNNNKHDGQLLLQYDALPEYSLELLVYLQGLHLHVVISWGEVLPAYM